MNNLQLSTQNLTLQKSIIEVIQDFTSTFNSLKTSKRYEVVLKEFFEFLEVKQLDEL